MIGSVLVANRGEIASRIFRTARAMGIRTIAVATEADRSWRHWQEADDALFIGDGPAADSYMNADKIIDAAKQAGAEAIHPGYGFLSENAAFARRCAESGIKFIGPPAAAIEAMGSKSRAKQIMEDAGVPTVPGYHGERQQTGFLKQKAYETGYPVVVKAVAGGGGRGMRVIDKAIDFEERLAEAQREALASFGDDRVLIERYLENPRHIEVQVIGDDHGNFVHLFERDCSVQRRHQKVIEEAPAPGVDEEISRAMGEAAIKAAGSVGYVNAGTVEFIVDGASLSPTSGFYFMEMNTRLQVEHPVTEMITGLDLVEWQFRVAAGEQLPLGQHDLAWNGHAIEARIYAEDAANEFKPSMGRLIAADFPAADELRVDTAVTGGTVVGPYYDSMLAKLVVHAPDRRQAIGKLQDAVAGVRIAGVKTNKAFLGRILRDPAFLTGPVETNFVDTRIADLTDGGLGAANVGGVINEWLLRQRGSRQGAWDSSSGFEIGGLDRTTTIDLSIDGRPASAALTWHDGQLTVFVDGEQVEEGSKHPEVIWDGSTAHLLSDGGEFAVSFPSALDRTLAGRSGSADVRVPMHGRITSLRVAEGDKIVAGDVLFTLEAMKMEHTIKAPADGTVSQVLVEEGAQVQEDGIAIVMKAGDVSSD